jgi:TusA-related sulfurtransferase
MKQSQYNLDITSDICPLTMVKAKLLIERMQVGDVASIRLNSGEPLDNVPRTLRDHGHEIIGIEPENNTGSIFFLLVRKGPDRW